jgi:hypothetical protein
MPDLGDFGGGAPEPGPEDQVKIDLSRWFENHGARVFWEKRPSFGYSTFSTQTAERPDLLVVGDRRAFAVEVKRGHDSAGVHDGAAQTLRYWKRYNLDGVDEFYRADGSQVSVDAFILATQFSPDGKLFYRYGRRDVVRQRSIEERLEYFDPPIHFLPDYEYGTTETVTRMLWRMATQSREQRPGSEESPAGIGTLLSSRLDGDQPTRPDTDDVPPFKRNPMPEPRALFKSFGEDSAGGTQCQNWRWVR